MKRHLLGCLALMALLAACGHGGGGATPTPTGRASTAGATPNASQSSVGPTATGAASVSGVTATSGESSPFAGPLTTLTSTATLPAGTATSAATDAAAPTSPPDTAGAATLTPAPPTPTPVSPTAHIRVGKWARVAASDTPSTQYVMGEVINDGGADASNVQVTVTLVDASGATIATDVAEEIMPVVKAGQLSPFAAVVLNVANPEAVADVQFQTQFDAFDPNDPATNVYTLDLSVTQAQWIGGSITGEVQNIGAHAAQDVTVLVIGYDADGNVVGVQQTYTQTEQIDPQASASFASSFVGFDVAPARVQAYAFGIAL